MSGARSVRAARAAVVTWSTSYPSAIRRSRTDCSRSQQLNRPELFAPLELVFCRDCSLVQITHTVPPEILFGTDYPYFSSVSKACWSISAAAHSTSSV